MISKNEMIAQLRGRRRSVEAEVNYPRLKLLGFQQAELLEAQEL